MVRLSLEQYNIGWISALPLELAAAQCMLDERHESLPTPNDPNTYTFGRIGDHNVVLACLPAGVTGTISTATVAMRMCNTFTSMRFSLMVGIGGAVPSDEADIRLGDIVVSEPDGTYGGVVQYLFGKQNAGEFERKGSLNRPPDVLLSAVSTLKANHELDLPKLLQHQKDMLEKYPRRRLNASYRGAEHDKLYRYNYHHISQASTCTDCDKDKLVTRQPRPQLDDLVVPEIHYGLIASGDWVMKDGETRERLRKELKVKCFEMEAAGMMDNFPCLVIRGICDYSDSHKNDMWQPYAAAIAAAYAKELLGVIAGTNVNKLPSAAKLTSE